jgi:hypothetical protein
VGHDRVRGAGRGAPGRAPTAGAAGAGASPDRSGIRLSGPGAEEGWADTEADAVGELDLSHSDGLSPEEAALTVRENPGGLTYDDSPDYLDDDAG